MALKPLTPGYLPLGQYDLLDAAPTIVGGEVGVFATTGSADYYAADAGGPSIGVDVKVTADTAVAGQVFGLLDEGTSGYGTLYGTVIGGTVGQGTGFASGVASSSASGIVVVGPKTSFASGKATLWTMPGLYGVTADAFASAPTASTFGPAVVLYGTAGTGKLATSGTCQVAVGVNSVSDSSLVSTSAAAATGSASATEYYAIYLLGTHV